MPETKTNKDEVVQISRGQLEEILENQRKLIEQVGLGTPAKPKENKTRKLTVFFIEGEPVTGYLNKGTPDRPKYIYEKQDPENKSLFLAYVDVLTRAHELDPKKAPYKLNFTEFLQECDRQECEIIGVDDKEWTINQGVVQGRAYQEGTYYMIEGALIPAEVKGITRLYKVKLPDGSDINIHERYVNINK